jgi:RNA polymerase-binding transcription factor DksA
VAPGDDRAAVLDGIEVDLADIDLALARLDAGTYGTCDTCGIALDEAVLVERPATHRCATCGWDAAPTGTSWTSE